MDLRYTPYDGSRQPFSIGLEPLEPARWIEPDAKLLVELAEKDALIASARDAVFRERPDTRDAQAEILETLLAHLCEHHAARYRCESGAVVIDGDRRVAADDESPLLAASRLVQEDLCLMRRDEDGWRLVAASLCFPSSWSLAEKFDRPMSEIHVDVPGFAGRMAERVARIFDHLRPGAPVWPLNWSIYDDGELHHPAPKQGRRRWSGENGSFAGDAFVRVERQTLRKMPASGDILFTIRVHVDPVAAFGDHPRGRELALGLRGQLLGLDEEQLRYKGMLAERDRIAAGLAGLAGGAPASG